MIIDFGTGSDDWGPAPAGPAQPVPAVMVAETTPVAHMDRSATLGDLATLGGVLSMVIFLFGRSR